MSRFNQKTLKFSFVNSRQTLSTTVCLLLIFVLSVQPVTAAKNVILLIGDGMGFQAISILMTYEKAQLLSGKGRDEKGTGVFTKLMATAPTGFLKTNPLRYVVTDSAAAATAMACGKKTLPTVLGKDGKGNPLKSVLKYAQDMGKKTGLVSTHCITDATPGGFYAQVTTRNDHHIVAQQLLATGVDVALGGGLKYFIPASADVAAFSADMAAAVKANGGYGGSSGRKDNLNLVEEAKLKGYKIVHNETQLSEVFLNKNDKLLGLFSPHHMSFEIDRRTLDKWQPSLDTMTEKALSTLDKHEEGFFLMVEGASIDSAGHYNDAAAILGETKAFAAAVETCLDYAKKDGDTLVIVTADHETGIPAFSYKKLRTQPAKQPFVDGDEWEQGYDSIAYDRPLVLDGQKLSFMRMFYRANRDPEKLFADMKKYTDYEYDLDMAKIALGKRLAPDEKVHYDDPMYEYYKANTIYFCGKIARTLTAQTGVTWATGHHGGTPVPIFAAGKGANAVRGLHDNTWIHYYIRSMLR